MNNNVNIHNVLERRAKVGKIACLQYGTKVLQRVDYLRKPTVTKLAQLQHTDGPPIFFTPLESSDPTTLRAEV